MRPRTENDSLHTVLGLQARNGPLAVLLKVVLYGAIIVVFAGPLLAVLVGAFSKVPNPTKFSLLPHGFTFDDFSVAGASRRLPVPAQLVRGRRVRPAVADDRQCLRVV